jgi:lipopolysaccharide biosynthesis protein
VTPSWDNSARRKNASIFVGSTPEKYENWLRQVVEKVSRRHAGDENIVFINAWNEWAEGNHLEPDLKWGRAYLEATRKGLQGLGGTAPIAIPKTQPLRKEVQPTAKLLYWKMHEFAKDLLDLLKNMGPGK